MAESPRSTQIDPFLWSRTRRLIVGRVAFFLLLLMANLWRSTGIFPPGAGDSADGLIIIFAVTALLSIAYLLALQFAGNILLQVRIQFVVDVGLITWLIWQTGDIVSPYITLYIVLISVSGFFLGKLETLWISITCAAVFSVLSGLASQEVFHLGESEQPPSRILQIVGVNNVAILLVGLLAARLSERRKLAEELRYSEESFADLHLLHERIVESIGTGLVTTDLAGRIYAFNRAAEEITGKRASNAIGESVFDLFGDDVRARIQGALSADALTAPLNFETELHSGPSASLRTVACSIVPLRDRSDQKNGLIITFQDITHLKSLEESVRRSDRLAAVGRMAAGLAHEIRNPLGSMSSALQFLQEHSPRPSDEGKLMTVVLRESDRLNSIISNFLAFARPSSNGDSKHREEVDVCSALKDCISLIEHSPEASEAHEFQMDLPDTPAMVIADETQLKQVFWNLARNAIQAMPDGGTLSIRIANAASNRILIEFADTGVGMTEETLEHIFEPFVTGAGGTGLGLSIVYKIVSDHGGTIDIQSRLGEGTRVAVVLREVFSDGQ